MLRGHRAPDPRITLSSESSSGQRPSFVSRIGAAGRQVWQRCRALLAREPLIAWLGAAYGWVMILRGQLPYLRHPQMLNIDEGDIVAIGSRMLEGQLLPYVDGISHRGPILYWAGALIAAFGDDRWMPTRIASAFTFLLVGALCFFSGRRAGYPLAGAVGVIGCAFVSAVMLVPQDGVAFNGEALMNAWVMGALWCSTRGLVTGARPPSLGWVAGAGVCVALAALSKQVAAFMVVPFSLWVLAAAFGHPAVAGSRRWRLLAAFALGGLGTLALVLLPYVLTGELRTFWYWFYRYNVELYMLPFKNTSLWTVVRGWIMANALVATLLCGAVGLAVGRLALGWRGWRRVATAYHEQGFALTVALGAVASVLGTQMAMRGWGHYFVQAVPWLALLVGLVAEPFTAGDRAAVSPGRAGCYQASVLVPLLLISELLSFPEARRRQAVAAAVVTPRICEVVKQHAAPGQKIFIWGFWPEGHVWCGRRPASRYVFSTLPAGLVPWDNQTKQQDDERAVPGSREQLIADLEQSKPPVIIDAPHTMRDRPMRRYEMLAAYLDRHYYWVAALDGLEVFVRARNNQRMLFDFEARGDMAPWSVEDAAFPDAAGPEPRPGHPVTGAHGSGHLNSLTLARGDAAIGRAVSPSFVIDRTRLGLLVGGGRSCSVALRVDNKIVFEQRGTDVDHLSEVVWDVTPYKGKSAELVLIDPSSGPWGHLLLDRVELFDP